MPSPPSSGAPRERALRALLLVACAAAFAGVGALLLRAETGPLSVQSAANLRFARQPGFGAALAEYPAVWPPLYPALLWILARAGVPPAWTGFALLQLGVWSLWWLARRVAPNAAALPWLALFALAHFQAVNLHQVVSEPLFAWLALAAFAALRAFTLAPSGRSAGALALASGAASLTRYFGALWLVPVLAHRIAVAPVRRGQRARWLALLAAGQAPALAWMAWARFATGHLTGTDRAAARRFSQLTDLPHNLRYAAKTVFLDWLSPLRPASHAEVALRPLQAAEWAVLAIAAVLAVAAVAALLRARRDAGAAPRSPDGALLAELCGAYAVVLLAVWTLGNNDPLYTRFLYPCYGLVLLGLLRAYAAVADSGAALAARLPFWGLGFLAAAAQIVRDVALLR